MEAIMRILDESTVRTAGPDHAEPAARHTSRPPARPPMSLSTLEFLAWLARQPRTYGETMEAWQTSCPRNSVWEDALGDGLCQLESYSGTIDHARVSLTPRGRAILVSA
jgi:hypothetical protein